MSLFLNVMTPDKKIRMFWDFLIGFILIIQMLYIPVFVSFLQEFDDPFDDSFSDFFFIIENVMIILFFFDIFFNFLTGFYHKGLYIDDKKKIAKHYIKKQFFIDIIPLSFLILVFWQRKSKYFSLFFMINIVKIKKIFGRLEEAFHLHLRFSSFLRLFKLAGLILFLSHISACLWHFIAIFELSIDKNAMNWLNFYSQMSENWLNRYIFSFYYSIVTIVTVGYGDVLPQNSIERAFSSFLILVGCGIFGYCLSDLGSIFVEISNEERKYKTKIAEINDYMVRNSVNFGLQIKVRRYLEYLFNEEKEGDFKGLSIINSLSKSIKEELLGDVYGKCTKKIQFFNKNFSQNFLGALALKFKEVSYAPEEIIFKVKFHFFGSF